MYTEYFCSCCKTMFQSRKNCLKHEVACYEAEAAAELLEQLPKELTEDNIGEAIADSQQMLDKLRRLAVYLSETTVRRENFFLGGPNDSIHIKSTTADEGDDVYGQDDDNN